MDKASTIKRRGEANEMITLARLHSDMNDTHSSPLSSRLLQHQTNSIYLGWRRTYLLVYSFADHAKAPLNGAVCRPV